MTTDGKTEQQTMIDWAHAYAYKWGELVFGEQDIHHTLDSIYEEWPNRQDEDPEAAAQSDFDAMAPEWKARYQPGGAAWRPMEEESGPTRRGISPGV